MSLRLSVKKLTYKVKRIWENNFHARLMSRNVLDLNGAYSTFEEAEHHASGYAESRIADQVSEAVIKLLEGKARYERDGICFDEVPSNLSIVDVFKKIYTKDSAVVDFGGGLGGTFLLLSDILSKDSCYTVIEQLKYVIKGEELRHRYKLGVKFINKIEELQSMPSIVIASGVLQYLKNPYHVLEKIARLDPQYILLDRLAYGYGGGHNEQVYHLQNCRSNFGGGSLVPFQLISWNKLLEILAIYNYEVVDSWINDFDPCIPKHGGFLFKQNPA